jgi:hypothetical protein
MKYVVSSVTRSDKNTCAIFKAMFPRSVLGIRVVFEIRESNNGIHFSRSINIGDYNNPVFCRLFAIISPSVVRSEYFRAIKEHNQDDLEKLKKFVETKF